MAGPLYRIRLYGHTSDDRDAFVRNLAAILGTDEEGARQTLLNVPAVIKDGLEKEKAQAVQDTLAMIKALSIMEPVEGEPTEPPDVAPSSKSALDERKVEGLLAALRSESRGKDEVWHSRIRFAGLLGFATVFLVLLGLVMMSFHGQSQVDVTSGKPTIELPDVSLGEIEAQMRQIELEREDLELQTEDMQIQLKGAMRRMIAEGTATRPNRERLLEVKQEIARLRSKLRSNSNRMKQLEQRMKRLGIQKMRIEQYEELSGPPPG